MNSSPVSMTDYRGTNGVYSAPSTTPAPPPIPEERSAYVAVTSLVPGDVLGGIVWWSLDGEVALAALTAALPAGVTPPSPVSAVVAVHRAAVEGARSIKGRPIQLDRGVWGICGKDAQEDATEHRIAFDLRARIAVGEDDSIAIDGSLTEVLQAAYAAALDTMAAADIGKWLCDRLAQLGAVPLRDRGGVYFVPADAQDKVRAIVAALRECSAHRVHVVPAMRADDAVEAILMAIEADTRASCDEIARELADCKLGKRGLEAREKRTAGLADRAARYEAILGVSLEGLKKSIDEATQAIAVAALTLAV